VAIDSHDDTITLNGVEYYARGLISGRAISEFSAGFKIGRATYDDREHAFVLPLDDLSAGIGFRRIDMHEALGGIWDNAGGVDVRRSRHVTLPFQRSTLSGFTAPTGVSFAGDARALLVSDITGAELMYAGVGNKVYTIPSARTSSAVVATLTNAESVSGIIDWRNRVVNNRGLYAFTINGALTSKYWIMSTAGVWTEGARRVWEALVWDGKLVAMLPLPAGNPWGPEGGIVCGYSTNGLSWNVDDVDAQISHPIWFFQGLAHFIGDAMAPWGGNTTPYFIDQGKLYALDFYKQSAMEIKEVGDKQRLTCGTVYEGQVWVSDGWNIWVYDPGAAETVRRVGIYNRFGVPPSMRGYVVGQIIGGTSTLYVIMNDDSRSVMRVLAYTGIGWTPVSPEITTTNPISSIVGRFPFGQSLTVPSRYLDVMCNTGELSTSLKLLSFRLPTSGDIPTPGDGFFEAGPSAFETGWLDGGFADLDGALHRLTIDAFSLTSTETVKVEYRLDSDETAGYTLLGTFNNSTKTIWFAANHRGVQFRTVQFKITLARGSTNTTTPELVALVLVYDKKPEFRSAWTFKIDLNRSTERQENTAQALWATLKALYDVKTLVPLIIPNVEPSPGINVRIVDMPLSLDDWRDAAKSKGYVEISVLQPLAG